MAANLMEIRRISDVICKQVDKFKDPKDAERFLMMMRFIEDVFTGHKR
eukprot:CAMPEP_0174985726 /NCGR_PEP_ID=MMETSP0004_2-20121128/18508_1 /TAXON_ID=420556 /ORGANISM="Ochromonas sp., Strain CCMP1393" /LENGTH=47 /DNA_ID= /DNA_START= /DNA_END= /DNA_ORIENTATION=